MLFHLDAIHGCIYFGHLWEFLFLRHLQILSHQKNPSPQFFLGAVSNAAKSRFPENYDILYIPAV